MRIIPVYFVCYDLVVRMTRTNAKKFIQERLSGGDASLAKYGRKARRSTALRGIDGHDSDRPEVMHWCEWKGYPCFNITDFSMRQWIDARRELEDLEQAIRDGRGPQKKPIMEPSYFRTHLMFGNEALCKTLRGIHQPLVLSINIHDVNCRRCRKEMLRPMNEVSHELIKASRKQGAPE